jgi:hypothetical protein
MSEEEKTIVRRELARAPIPSSARREVIRLEGSVSLPQIVVCGDQLSGKSSVLEAITEIPFPRKENLCTRFATEIVLRRAPTPSIRTRIIPEKTRPKQVALPI